MTLSTLILRPSVSSLPDIAHGCLLRYKRILDLHRYRRMRMNPMSSSHVILRKIKGSCYSLTFLALLFGLFTNSFADLPVINLLIAAYSTVRDSPTLLNFIRQSFWGTHSLGIWLSLPAYSTPLRFSGGLLNTLHPCAS